MDLVQVGTRDYRRIGVVAGLVAVALVARALMVDHQSSDYTMFLSRWYDFIAANGGFGALKHQFADYNVPYLYLLAILTYLPVPPLAGIKIISVLFDLLLAFFAYRIVGLRRTGWVPVAAGLAVLFLPTVMANSGLLAQADAIYSSFALGGVYFVLRRRPWLAGVFFGLSLAVKLQAVFLFPLLLLLVLVKWLPWRSLLAIPAVVLLLDVPALLVGAPSGQLLSIYAKQTGSYQALTVKAPSIYQFLPAGVDVSLFRTVGVVVTGVVVLGLIGTVVVRRIEPTPTRIVLMALVSAIVVPFLLPAMHERYFYLADVLTLVAAFYVPARLWYTPILLQVASFLAYTQVMSPDAVTPGVTVNSGPPSENTWLGPVVSSGGSVHAPTLEFRVLAALVAVALIAALRATVREFQTPTRPRMQGVHIFDGPFRHLVDGHNQ
nr:glycosyltransferase 87 family protein [Kibdelosporangium sp. MJ126-NF4]CEL18702.1 hypothetical protein [Kibdelosporangium sp. MJ126-NF4]CTQ98186.1 hypothetical protein [Kibdelosporangium sp. MJ126-NF4]